MKKLLAIVDDWELLERYEDKLATHFEVHCAPFGDHGLKMAKDNRPDFLLIDLALGDMTAEEIIREVRAMQIDAPALIVIDTHDPDLRKHPLMVDTRCKWVQRPAAVETVCVTLVNFALSDV